MGDQLETLFRPLFKGKLTLPTSGNPAGGQFAGRTTLPAGSAHVIITTTAVKSDSIIRYGVQVTSAAANSFGNIVVNSVVDSTAFAFARDGIVSARDAIVMWEIVNTL